MSNQLQQIRLQIQGMHCASCLARVENQLRAVPGVQEVEISLVTGQARLRWDPCKSSPEALTAAVQQCGYSAQVVSDQLEALRQAFVHQEIEQVAWWRHRFLVAFGLLVPMVFISLWAEELAGLRWGAVSVGVLAGWFAWILATCLQVYVGGPYVVASVRQLRRRTVTMDTLVALGSSVAYVAGTVDWWLGQWGIVVWRTHSGEPSGSFSFGHSAPGGLLGDGLGMHFAEAGMILTFVTLGYWLEHRAKAQASKALRRLVELTPLEATVLRDGQPQQVPLEMILPGQTIIIRPGEKIPLDAEVLTGSSTADESWLTGESIPVPKQPGALVLAGTINGPGTLTARVVRPAGQTALAQVIELVRHAQESKPPLSRLADQVVAWFVPAVLALAVGVFAVWAAVGDWPMAFRATVAVLVAACPCALGLATPMAVVIATGRAAQQGILVKDAAVLELAGRIDTIVLDKTGTLTEGKPRLVCIMPSPGVSEEELLITAATATRLSTHPLAQALAAEAQRRQLSLPQTLQMSEIPGQGIRAIVAGREVLVGNRRFLAEADIADLEKADDSKVHHLLMSHTALSTPDESSERSTIPLPPQSPKPELAETGISILWVAGGGRLLGRIALADPVSQTSYEAIQQLKALGLQVHLLSGDRREVAQAVANLLGIQHVMAEVLPEQKQAVIQQLRGSGRVVAMVGDGINDAPALAAADLGIAIGAGADVALETAQVILVRNDLRDVVRLIQLGRRTVRIIRQNLAWAFGYNLALLPLAAGVLVPWGGPHVPPAAAAAAMAASDLCVVSNSLRLRCTK
ncbi:MAG: heavy metal translocating P-type ATPase [Thermoguttaceae bacterium]|nr:heavy metal translocating P-type ATPase [Thermoguttaceae bacterium]MDW8036899.1 heavy metal translocating P-type ATPase [Thermoguttaceae bacterium]